MREDTINEIKREMGYVTGKDTCVNCTFFVPTDCSGTASALPMHCTRNAFILPVEETGHCQYWERSTL